VRDEEDTPDTADRGGLEWHAPSSYMYIHICDWMYTHVHIHIQRGGISLSLSLYRHASSDQGCHAPWTEGGKGTAREADDEFALGS